MSLTTQQTLAQFRRNGKSSGWRCHTQSPILGALNHLLPFLLFAVLIWIANYWHFHSFGLYEDDYYRIPKAMKMTFADQLRTVEGTLVHFRGQGRPLHPLFIYGLSSLAYNLDGLQGIYLAGYLIVVGNSFLFYQLLKRLSDEPEVALLGTLAFCVFPADTTRAFITHSLGLQPALTVLLVAFHFYLSKKPKASYALIFFSLFIYETVFPVFFAAPLLERKTLRDRYTVLKHVLILTLMLLFDIVLRLTAGEKRISAFGLREAGLALLNPAIGPLTTMVMFLYRPLEMIGSLRGDSLLVLGSFIAVAGVLTHLVTTLGSNRGTAKNLASQNATGLLRSANGHCNLMPSAALMLVLAYPFTLTTIGFAVSGRGTRVHMAAVVGGSMLCGCMLSAIVRLAVARGRRILVITGVSVWVALLVAFGLAVQQDYMKSWDFQKSFWTDVLHFCPDLTDGTVILVDPKGLPDNRQLLFLRRQIEGIPDTRQIKYLQYPYLVLPEVYEFPSGWKEPPVLYRLPVDWKRTITINGSSLIVTVLEGGQRISQRVARKNIILLETDDYKVMRRLYSIKIKEHDILLKAQGRSTLGNFNAGPLFKYFTQSISP